MIDKTIRDYLCENYTRYMVFDMLPTYKNYIYKVNSNGQIVLIGFVDESKVIYEIEKYHKIYIEPFFDICDLSVVLEDSFKTSNQDILIELGNSFEIIQLFQWDSYSKTPFIIKANSVSKIEYNAFSHNKCLKSFEGNNVKLVEEFAFYNCVNLESVKLNNCIELQNEAFSECIRLKTVDVPKCVIVGDSCFPHLIFV